MSNYINCNIGFIISYIDLINQAIFKPNNKVAAIQQVKHETQDKSKIKLNQRQSLVVSLSFITKASPAGRTITCR
jgi:hypothetical protein